MPTRNSPEAPDQAARIPSNPNPKMKSLPIFVNLAGRSVLVLGHGPAAQAKARLVENSGGSVVSQIEAADDPPSNPPNNSPNNPPNNSPSNPPNNSPSNPQTYQGIRLAFIALDDEAAILEAVHRLRAKRVLVNVVDRGELCDFTTPAIIDRAPVILAIGTSGKSAGLAKALRQRLETILPATLGPLAEALAGARHAIRKRWSAATTRRRAIDAALASRSNARPLARAPRSSSQGHAMAANARDKNARNTAQRYIRGHHALLAVA